MQWKIKRALPAAGCLWTERIGYGLGDMSYNIIFQFVNAYLLFYYTDVDGISPAIIGTLFLVVRVLDAVFDPVMGAIMDKTKSRWGKPGRTYYGRQFLLLCLLFYVLQRPILVWRATEFMHT